MNKRTSYKTSQYRNLTNTLIRDWKYILLLISIVLQISGLSSNSLSDHLALEGNLSLWWDIYEQNENGILQTRTGSPAADVASGFNLKQGRISLNYRDNETPMSARFQIRLEERVALLDGYGVWSPSQLFHLYLGQMKIPTTYEVLIADSELDFVSRTTLSRNLTDWSLSRSPYYSALYGSRSYNRDLGIGIKGTFGSETIPSFLSYFLMAGNGLGANLFIGGKESKEFIFTNNLGDYFYSARLDASPFSWLSIGGHYSVNKHDKILFNDEKTVFDLDRRSWSVDSQLESSRVRIAAMYGAGKVDDNYFYTAEKDLDYSGYEFRFLIWLIQSRLQLGTRYDIYTYRFLGSGISTDQRNLTVGLNIVLTNTARLQLNYIVKKTDNQIEQDPKDNILLLNLQHSLNISNLFDSKNP